MTTRVVRTRRWRLLLLGLGLILVLPFSGDFAHAAPLQPASVSLTMNNPTCIQVRSASGACSIQVDSVIASGSDPTFSRLEILVNGKLRVYMSGFFESSAYLTYSMMPGGFAVVCGQPNAGGSPNYGNAYTVTANAYMADGTSASDSMAVFCPAYESKTYIPLLKK
jgi:hypothetical protein